ncbi:hypothetical protein CYMTET_50009 [Cymbomonas tetramitiformis]|uniref:Protein kinase domain-containing protein n=1 Tax=Cymbomonas tetramitiformis TaxID=36881 RepID=A0AAE0EU51_9CHLO|nr:hypothetical protein CYMTET_50009 [Cymbomonas tetramitiformis]
MKRAPPNASVCIARPLQSFRGILPQVLSRRRVAGRRQLRVHAASTTSVSGVSQQMKDIRAQMEEDEDLSILMRGLRGQGVNDDDFAASGVTMRLVEVDADSTDSLPLTYDPEAIAAYWRKRPFAVTQRIFQLLTVSGGFLSSIAFDIFQDKVKANEVKRASELRDIVTSLGPAYIKLGQALSIRPDILSPAAMNELQKLCDKVPAFDNAIAMKCIEEELGLPPNEIYDELTPDPIAAASLGQVYKGILRATGDEVAVKVQRPYVLETVSVDLYVIRRLGMALREVPSFTTDVVALLDEFAMRFFEELDYVKEGENATRFAADMAEDLPQVVVPKTFADFTSRKVLTSGWLEGEKLSQSTALDVGDLVNVGVICYLKQLLDTGFFHADPHPGNLIRTPDGRLAILDFGLMTEVSDDIKYGMIEAISHLIHRDYDNIVKDFVTLDFIPDGVDLNPIKPVLAKVFDQALEGGGAKNINFQELAADLAQITFDYPFRIPPYFALIIRAIGTLEGIALVGNSDFALVDEAYPYISKRLLTDDSPRLREGLRYMIYGKTQVFDVDRMIDLLTAFESYTETNNTTRSRMAATLPEPTEPPTPFPLALPNGGSFGPPAEAGKLSLPLPSLNLAPLPRAMSAEHQEDSQARAALTFILSKEGDFFRNFLVEEAVKGIDALSREQAVIIATQLGLQQTSIPILLPGAVRSLRITPHMSEEDRQIIKNTNKLTDFLLNRTSKEGGLQPTISVVQELLPLIPNVASTVAPEIASRLSGRVAARVIREIFVH